MDRIGKSFVTVAFAALLSAFAASSALGAHAWQCLPPLVPDSASRVIASGRAGVKTAAKLRTRRVEPSGPVTIDVLIAYDSRARLWADANGGGTRAFAEREVEKSNAALVNTGLDSLFSFRLVGVMELATDCGDAITTNLLVSLQSAAGEFGDVAAKRNEVGADIVSLFVDTGTAEGVAGFGYSLREDKSWNVADFSLFERYAFNICAIRAVDHGHTLTHEIGHNMGAGHSDIQAGTPGPQFYEYSAAYYFNAGGKDYHTIMAYGCDGTTEIGYTEIPYFSSPHYQYSGVAVGDAKHDNTLTLQNSYRTVSEFRADGGTGGGTHAPLVWHSSRAEALRAACAAGKKVLLIAGLEGDPATVDTRTISCESAVARAAFDGGYVLWYSSASADGRLDEEVSCYFTEMETIYNPGIAVIDPLVPTKAAACSSGHHSTAELLYLFDDAVTESAGVASVDLIAPELVVNSFQCHVIGVVTNGSGESVCVTNAATWRIAAGEAATVSADGTIHSVAGKSGLVTVEATFSLWGTSYTLKRDVTVVDTGVVTGLVVDGAKLFDLYDETSTVFVASLQCSTGSRYPVDAKWSVKGDGIQHAQISDSGVLSFSCDQYTVYEVATARVSATFGAFSGSADTQIFGPGYVYVYDFEINRDVVSPGVEITITPKQVCWWRHGQLEAPTADLSDVEFGWQLQCDGGETNRGFGTSFTVPANAVSTSGYCFVDALARPKRARYYDWMVSRLRFPFKKDGGQVSPPGPDDPSSPGQDDPSTPGSDDPSSPGQDDPSSP